jgi:hypothetical protein
LVVVQYYDDNHVSLHVIDPSPWYTSQETRQSTYGRVRKFVEQIGWANLSKTVFDGEATWITVAEASDRWHSGYYTILHAWAVALNLPLNAGFRPGSNFFEDARFLFDLMEHGYGDWKLVWSFLRCNEFVQANEEAIHSRSKFANVVSAVRLNDHFERLRAKSQKPRRNSNDNIQRYDFPEGRPHTETLESDDWTREVIAVVPELMYRNLRPARTYDSEALGGILEEFRQQREHPCQRLRDQLTGKTINLQSSRNQDHVTQIHGTALLVDEVQLAIASITQAEFTNQGEQGNYSCLV